MLGGMRARTRRPLALSPDRRCLLWVRVSTEEQAEHGYSQAAQLEQLREYARREGLAVMAEHVVDESASKDIRRAFDAMLRALARPGAPRHLIAAEADRLSRSLRSDVALDDMRRAGLHVHLVREARVLGPEATSHDLLLWDVRAMIARHEARHLRERVLYGMRRKAREGLHVGGPIPLGYRLDSGTLVPNDAAPVVAEMYARCADGEAFEALAELASRRGVCGTRGAPMSRATVAWMLRSPVYRGDIAWGGELHEGRHAGIVSRELWSRAQLAIDARRTGGRKPRGQRRTDLELSGVLTCAASGRAMVGEVHKARFRYYRCHARGCPEPPVREEVLRDAVAGALESVRLSETKAEAWRSIVRHERAVGDRERQAQLTRLRVDEGRLSTRLRAAYTDAVDGVLPRDEMERMTADWRRDLEAVRTEMATVERADAAHVEAVLDVIEIATTAAPAYRRADATGRREILAFVARGGTWGSGRLALELSQPFEALGVTPSVEGGRPVWWASLDGIRTGAALETVRAWVRAA